jgi:monofunctional biosynthetic peptidoglycan transglycosylase
MLYREKQWKEEGLDGKKVVQRWVPYSRISPYLKNAVLISEDDRFWNNDGFDFDAMESAVVQDIKAGRFKFGASTITQQLARNLYLSPSKNLLRKMKEAILAWRLNRDLSKRRILELYLNVAEWGDGIFGIGAASYHYFGKPASALTPMEAARLASILPNPIRFSPVRPSGFVERRSRAIYDIMVKRGVVQELDQAVTMMEKEGPGGLQNSASSPGLSNSSNAPAANSPSETPAAPGQGPKTQQEMNEVCPQNQQPSP